MGYLRRLTGALPIEGSSDMKFNVIALAGALLSLTAAAAQASPATVIPDTFHGIARGTKQIVDGTGKAVTDQYHHDATAARRTTGDIRHGRILHHPHRRHHHHHLVSRTTHTHTVEQH